MVKFHYKPGCSIVIHESLQRREGTANILCWFLYGEVRRESRLEEIDNTLFVNGMCVIWILLTSFTNMIHRGLFE